jgi:hypothetical protein
MFASRTFFGAGAVRPHLTDRSVSEINPGTAPADAYIRFEITGGLYVNGATAFTVADEWMTQPVTAAQAQLYDLVVVKNSGSLQYGAPGTFQLGLSPLAFGCSVDTNGGVNLANITCSIVRRSDSAVMASATFNFEAVSSNA